MISAVFSTAFLALLTFFLYFRWIRCSCRIVLGFIVIFFHFTFRHRLLKLLAFKAQENKYSQSKFSINNIKHIRLILLTINEKKKINCDVICTLRVFMHDILLQRMFHAHHMYCTTITKTTTITTAEFVCFALHGIITFNCNQNVPKKINDLASIQL